MVDPINAALGRAVRQARLDKQLSQEELAHVAGLDRTYISGLERGVRNPAISTLAKVARALDSSLAVLFLQAEASQPPR